MIELEYISHDFKLPDNCNELSMAEDAIDKLKHKIKNLKSITDNEHTLIYEEIIRVLDYVGRLSMPYFEIAEELECLYVIKYPHSPELAKKLWLDHYELIHKPYNLLKNRCFRALDELDDFFIETNKRNPQNWKI